MRFFLRTFAGLIFVLGTSLQTFCAESVQPLKIHGIENAFRVTENIYSGSQPEDDAAFAALAQLGVKTVVSVDGLKPNVEAARKNGLRYIHLPFGYDGVPTNRLSDLASLGSAVQGPVFVHCHHGQHRGPTAVAILCLASENWTPQRAEAWMREAGTSDDYPGLYRSVREFKNVPTLVTAKTFPEIADTPSLVDTMVIIDELFDRLKQTQKPKRTNGSVATIPIETSAAHDALLLVEQFREMARTTETAQRPKDFRGKLTDALHAADELRQIFAKSGDTGKVAAALKQTAQSCVACHKKYRN